MQTTWVALLALHLATDAVQPSVNDVTQLNPIIVARIVRPTSVAQIQTLVREHAGPVSVGGGRFSMGGQIATDNALFIDMRDLNKVIGVNLAERTVTVEAGATWHTVQAAIDPRNMSVRVMQTYANFTVGGSLSVNCHGRYIGEGPIAATVESLQVVLADGTLVMASRREHADLFSGVLGGYGGLGVIVHATLHLTDNVNIQRDAKLMPVGAYKSYFYEHVRGDAAAVFHNGDIYPPDFSEVMAITWRKTDEAVTILPRLMPADRPQWTARMALYLDAATTIGKRIRHYVVEPLSMHNRPVAHRNYEASYDVNQLEPMSGADFSFVLQEYFVPVENFDAFIRSMAAILQKHQVNVLNVSIRHARADTTSLLSWAPVESFAFVLYYEQGTKAGERKEVEIWTRELIDAAENLSGTYYLPYQMLGTQDQFRRGYSNAERFFMLKRLYDPTYKFRNRLFDRYYAP